jgi:histidinol dehydrogenase
MTREAVSGIIEDVRTRGDSALRELTLKYDKVQLEQIEVSRAEIESAAAKVPTDVMAALKFAFNNVRKFSEKQAEQLRGFETQTSSGVFVGQSYAPIERVGVYVPGGRFPLPSSVLMACVPAMVAGVKDIVLCSPPSFNGTVNPLILAAAEMCGVGRVFRVGGAQAVAAMAFGTESVPKVDKIVGPGNEFVAEAKRQVFGEVGIDVIAGPSEVLVIADGSANADYVMAEMAAQLEHGDGCKAALLTDSAELGLQVKKLVEGSTAVIKSSIDECVALANEIGPEHISLQVAKPLEWIGKLKNYGSLFVGSYACVAFGDYCSGTNHILPTSGASRYADGLSVRSFIRQQTYQYITENGFRSLADTAKTLAKAEGLLKHRESVEVREKRT